MYLKTTLLNENKERIIYRENTNIDVLNRNTVDVRDVFNDPYKPPIKHNHFMRPNSGLFNQHTSHYNLDYKQLGILSRPNGKETILPLFGRPLHSNRNKWQYYSMTDKNHMVKIPISKDGRSCTNEYGCDELFNEDIVHAEGYNDIFKVTIYDNY